MADREQSPPLDDGAEGADLEDILGKCWKRIRKSNAGEQVRRALRRNRRLGRVLGPAWRDPAGPVDEFTPSSRGRRRRTDNHNAGGGSTGHQAPINGGPKGPIPGGTLHSEPVDITNPDAPEALGLPSVGAARATASATGGTTRPTTKDGKVSFHFAHSYVSKGKDDGKGAPHQDYMERTKAVAETTGPWSAGDTAAGQNVIYTERPSAVAQTSSGQRAMFGTIGETKAARRHFWRIVEEAERKNGRIQNRIIGELPHELSVDQMMALLWDFTQEFRRRNLPFWLVIHAPEDGNDQRNFHFHMAYYDRPCTRLPDGRWDFERVEIYKTSSREERQRRPNMQAKDRDANLRSWPKRLRHLFADISNRHMEAAGITKRYDPRTYKDMGIDREPGVHLGNKAAAMERRGEATARGVMDADKIFGNVEREIDRRYAHKVDRLVDFIDEVRAKTSPLIEEGDADEIRLRKIARDFTKTEILLAELEHRHRRFRKAEAQALGRARGRLKWARDTLASLGEDPQSKRAEGLKRAIAEAQTFVTSTEAEFAEWAVRFEQAYADIAPVKEGATAYRNLIRRAFREIDRDFYISDTTRRQLQEILPDHAADLPPLVTIIDHNVRRILGIADEANVKDVMRSVQASAMNERHMADTILAAADELNRNPSRYGMPGYDGSPQAQPTTQTPHGRPASQRRTVEPPAEQATATASTTIRTRTDRLHPDLGGKPAADRRAAAKEAPRATVEAKHTQANHEHPKSTDTPAAAAPKAAHQASRQQPPQQTQEPTSAQAPEPPAPIPPAPRKETQHADHHALNPGLRAVFDREGYEYVVIEPTSTLLPAGWMQGNMQERQMKIVNHIIAQATRDESVIDRLAAHAGKVLVMDSLQDSYALRLVVDAAAKGRDEDKPQHEIIKAMMDAAEPIFTNYTAMMRRRELRKEMDAARARERGMDMD